MSDHQPQHTEDGWEKLMKQKREERKLIDELNAQFSRPGAWTIGKELGGDWLAAGIVKAMAKHGPRKETQ
jgi:hypothetical protein